MIIKICGLKIKIIKMSAINTASRTIDLLGDQADNYLNHKCNNR